MKVGERGEGGEGRKVTDGPDSSVGASVEGMGVLVTSPPFALAVGKAYDDNLDASCINGDAEVVREEDNSV